LSSAFVFEQLEAPEGVVSANSTAADRAAEIVAEAESRAAEIEEQARRAGCDAGYAEGVARAESEAKQALAALNAAVEAVNAAQSDAVTVVEARAAELAVLVAERILGVALELDPELVCSVIGSALRRVVDADRLVLDVNPDDLERVRAWISAGEGRLAQIEVRPERRVGPGGCIVRTADVEIDARVSAQLDRARTVVRSALR
jgi:flagellar biosynthesis/type III secretory pathway protein FliH